MRIAKYTSRIPFIPRMQQSCKIDFSIYMPRLRQGWPPDANAVLETGGSTGSRDTLHVPKLRNNRHDSLPGPPISCQPFPEPAYLTSIRPFRICHRQNARAYVVEPLLRSLTP